MNPRYTISNKIRRFTFLAAVAMAVALALAFALSQAVQPARAFADESASSPSAQEASDTADESDSDATSDEASDEAASSNSASDSAALSYSGSNGAVVPLMGNDLVWFGERFDYAGITVGNDFIAAGRTIMIDDLQAPGSIRAAAQEIEIKDSSVVENITVGAESVSIKDTSANAVAAACRTFSFSGSCSNLTAYASKVFIDGTVEGDVVVGASEVEIGTNARIKGTLHVSAPKDPVMQRGAEVADVDFVKTKESSPTPISGTDVAKATSMLAIVMAIVGVIATIITAVLAEWLFRRHTAAAADMIRTRTGATIGSGIIGAIVAPIVVIILCCLVITLPVAIGATLALFAMSAVSGGFMGASLFKLVFPRLGRFVSALIGGAIIGVLSAIPYLGAIVSALAFMYFLGYVLQSIFLGMKKDAPVYGESIGGAHVGGTPYTAAPTIPQPPYNTPSV